MDGRHALRPHMNTERTSIEGLLQSSGYATACMCGLVMMCHISSMIVQVGLETATPVCKISYSPYNTQISLADN